MIEIIKELNIEVSKPNVFQAVVAKQYDMNTRFIKATFVDGGDKITIDPSSTVSVVINALRPDGESKGFDGVINEDGTVTVPLHSWMLELVGTVICDISVIDTETNDNRKLTTTSFTLLVEKAAYGGEGITSDPQYDVLVQLLETCSTAGEVAEEALAKSEEANSKYSACVEATAAAKAAANNANNVRAEIEEGGFIESLKELNEGKKFSFWVGTQAEYDLIQLNPNTALPSNCFCIVTDDINEDETNPGCYYRMVGDEKEWLNPPMVKGVEYRTNERHDGKPLYTKLIVFNAGALVTGKVADNIMVVRAHANTSDVVIPYKLADTALYRNIDILCDSNYTYSQGGSVGTSSYVSLRVWYYKR